MGKTSVATRKIGEIVDPCELPQFNADSEEIRRILSTYKTVAVIGISPKEHRPSHWIAQYLKEQGYRVIGVNPGHEQILGEKVYPSLSEVPEPVDIVDIFRRPEAVDEIVEEAIAKKAKVIWMQEGIVNNQAAQRARAAGLTVVMNKCIYKEHQTLI